MRALKLVGNIINHSFNSVTTQAHEGIETRYAKRSEDTEQ